VNVDAGTSAENERGECREATSSEKMGQVDIA
jgi:hypothetical protein